MSDKPISLKLMIYLSLFMIVVSKNHAKCIVSNEKSDNQIVFSHQQEENVMLNIGMQLENATKHSNNTVSSCPPWFYNTIYNSTSSECTCGPIHHEIIHCDETQQISAVLDCYCVTYDDSRSTTVSGACFYNCDNFNNTQGIDVVYHKLPNKVSELNKHVCGRFNRTGPLCGQCVNGSYPLAYSYNLSCIYCPDGHRNWWKFIFAAFVPLTAFYFIVLFFKMNANSSHLHAYVYFSQAVSSPAFIRFALMYSVHSSPAVLNAVKVGVSLYGIWNLDFFRAFIPNICLQTSTLQTLALDYAIAVYPLFLMIISYMLIELHDRNFRLVVVIWKPFRFVLTFFRRNWDSRTSVIDAYATLFLLSFMKFLSVSFDILTPTSLYVFNSSDTTLVLYYDGSIEYFGKEHLPFAILAIVILGTFIILPTTVLFLYPFKFFQKFLSCFPNRWITILRTFVDSFLGCYKDGTEPGTRDCRWFAVVFLVARILVQFIYSLTVGYTSDFKPYTILLLLLLVILLAKVRPFKPTVSHFTGINITFGLLLAMLYTGNTGTDFPSIKAMQLLKPFNIISVVIVSIPLIYISVIVLHWLFSQRKWGKNLILKFRAWRQGYDWMAFESDQDTEDSLPDRIVNPHQYHEGNLSDFHNTHIEPIINDVSNTY